MGDRSRFWLFCLGLLVFLLPMLFSYLAFLSLNFERTHKCVVRTKLDIYVFITNRLHNSQYNNTQFSSFCYLVVPFRFQVFNQPN